MKHGHFRHQHYEEIETCMIGLSPVSKSSIMQYITAYIIGIPLLCRNGFPEVVRILDQVVGNLGALAPGEEVDVNNVTLRLALDITGLVGFAKDFGTTRSFSDSGTDELFFILQSSAA